MCQFQVVKSYPPSPTNYSSLYPLSPYPENILVFPITSMTKMRFILTEKRTSIGHTIHEGVSPPVLSTITSHPPCLVRSANCSVKAPLPAALTRLICGKSLIIHHQLNFSFTLTHGLQPTSPLVSVDPHFLLYQEHSN